MAMDHPIGDPTGGPAYGEKNDPVSAVVAVATMAMTYEAAFVVGSVAAGMMFAGAAMSLVGNATGNKNLQMLGTVVGIAGGVGSLANLAEASASAGSSVSGEAISAANASDDAIGALNSSQGWTATGGAEAAGATGSASEAVIGSSNPNTVVNSASAMDAPAASMAPETSTRSLLTDSAATQAPTNASVGQQVVYDDGSSAVMNSNGSFAEGSVQAAPDSAFGAGGPAGTPYSTWDKFTTGVKNMMPDTSKMSTMDKLIATKMGADVVGGVMNYIAPTPQQEAQTDQAKANAEYARTQSEAQRAQLELQRQRIANLNANMQQGLGFTVNPNALKIQNPGLIARQMTAAKPA